MADTGFIWAEDEALKTWLQGLRAMAPNAPGGQVTVETRYGYPTKEVVRTYPMIVIDLIDVVPNWEETHSTQHIVPTYWPDELPTLAASDPNHVLQTWEFIPVYLMYQVASYSRSSLHNRAIINSILLALPFRWGELYVPADDTTRRMDLLDIQHAPYIDSDNKRTFRTVFTIQVQAEIPPFKYSEFSRTQTVSVDIETI